MRQRPLPVRGEQGAVFPSPPPWPVSVLQRAQDPWHRVGDTSESDVSKCEGDFLDLRRPVWWPPANRTRPLRCVGEPCSAR